MSNTEERISSSFRDPGGYLFKKNNILYRKVHNGFKKNYDAFISSGLYKNLSQKGLLISHKEVDDENQDAEVYKILEPQPISFISYPYEWSFSQLKDAALLTLEIQKIALQHNLTLKDASAFNVTYKFCSPIFIDSLSFESYVEGKPWNAYGQFCRHFLAPLMLMKYAGTGLVKLFQQHLDGIPLTIASRILSWKTYFSFPILIHIHLHARSIEKYASINKKIKNGKMNLVAQQQLIAHLENSIRKLDLNVKKQENTWKDYYANNNYSTDAFDEKINICKKLIEKYTPKNVCDIGCNTGIVSMISAKKKIPTIALDNDHSSIEQLYTICRNKQFDISPLYLDITNPTPACGWAGIERESLNARGPADMVFVLALIHHLVIANNISFSYISNWLKTICRKYLILEFISKNDTQIKKMLINREDIFQEYTQAFFEKIFSENFNIIERYPLSDSNRIIYFLQVKL